MSKSEQSISLKEHLSAVLDDEAGKFEQTRVLDELSTDHTLCEKLSRYALIGESMRAGELESKSYNAGPEFLNGIHKSIEDEETFAELQLQDVRSYNQSKLQQNRWLKPVGGIAIAASLAAVTFLGIQNYQLQNLNTQLQISANQQLEREISVTQNVNKSKRTIAATEADNLNEQYKTADIKTRSMLKRYVESHMQHAATAAFVPSVRVIAYADYQ